jgi:hypothetical protein
MKSTETVNVVTTMHLDGYERYGRTMIRTFLDHWPANAQLTVYAQDFEVAERSDRLGILNLHETCPELLTFKKANTEPWKNGLTGSAASKQAWVKLTDAHNFKFDAVKFSNKVFAYCRQATLTDARYLVWLDADTVTLKPIPEDFIPSLGKAFIEYLGRRYTHSECGFMRFDMHRPNAQEFFSTIRAMYETGEIYTLNEWHDSFVFDVVRSVMCASGTIDAHSISKYDVSRHPFIDSVLGAYMDHLKGNRRKILGSSTARDRGNETVRQKILRRLKLGREI